MKTQIGEYDTFTANSFIDVAVSDADSIIHLEAFADRILQFKEDVVHVINISKDYEFLELSYKHAGVRAPSQVVQTPLGIFWANKKGLFVYDGKAIQNILTSQRQNFVSAAATLSSNYIQQSLSSWGEIISEEEGYEPIVTYDPINKEVLILNQGTTDIGFIYNVDSKTMTQIFDKADSGAKSNPIITVNGECMYLEHPFYDDSDGSVDESGKFSKWSSAAVAEDKLSLFMLTKALDFGNHAQRKVIQSINFTYKVNGTCTLVPYITGFFLDGTSPQTWYLCTSSATGIDSAALTGGSYVGQLQNTSGNMETLKYKHVLSSNTTGNAISMRSKLKNVGAIQIGLAKLSTTNTIPADFSLEEIAITFRGKSHK